MFQWVKMCTISCRLVLFFINFFVGVSSIVNGGAVEIVFSVMYFVVAGGGTKSAVVQGHY